MTDRRFRRYHTERHILSQYSAVLAVLLVLVTGVSILRARTADSAKAVELPSPFIEVRESPKAAAPSILPEGSDTPKTGVAPSDNPQRLDLLIGQSVDEFFTDRSKRSEMRMIMHCLAHRENGHGANDHCGDSGLACGPFQFHQDTWNRMRGQMIKQGVASQIGDRYDLKEATRTTVWAIKNGRALEWGPINRDAKGSNYAACQKPSWY